MGWDSGQVNFDRTGDVKVPEAYSRKYGWQKDMRTMERGKATKWVRESTENVNYATYGLES